MGMKASPPSLVGFKVSDLNIYTKEGAGAGVIPDDADHWLFYVGRDDVHAVLRYLLARVSLSLYLNMFGYDDEELDALVMCAAADPTVTTLVTLDKSQAGGVHEKKILAADVAKDPAAFNTHFVVGTSATNQISHTKGGVLDGLVGVEGSTNWSTSGEGTFLTQGKPGGAGYKAQNNTLMVFTDPTTLTRFTAELIAEHAAAGDHGKVIAA